jgi:tetratricopeptide (TPR) repeat protein
MALIADTVAQNPTQKDLRGLYMLAYIRSGDLKSAREQYRIASTLKNNKYLENYDLNMAAIEISEGNYDEAEDLFKKVLHDTHGKSVSAIKFYMKFLENEVTRTKDLDRSMLLQDEIISLYNQLYMLNKDPFYLYRLGQIYIARKDVQAAIRVLEQAAQAYPLGSMYGENSSKIVQKLKNKMQPL